MAIAFRSAGAPSVANVSLSGSPVNFALPAGHVANDLLIAFVITDDLSGPGTPSGWTKLHETAPSNPTSTPYSAPPRTTVFYRIDNGSLGSTVAISFNTGSWTIGDPFVLGAVLAYSGCDTTAPIGEWAATGSSSFPAAQVHPQLTTSLANDWLITWRASSGTTATTYTISGGTNAERVDTNDGFPELSMLIADSNGALSAGLQTQRTTTASDTQDYGSGMWSIAIRPSPAAGATVAQAGAALGAGTAFDATAITQDGPWDLCGTGGLPKYGWTVDWTGDGLLIPDTELLNLNPYAETNTSDWTSLINATLTRAVGEAPDVDQAFKLVSTASTNPRAETTTRPLPASGVVRVMGWLYAPVTLPTSVTFGLNWFDASNVFLSSSFVTQAITAGTWTFFDATYDAPAGAGRSNLRFGMTGTPGAGQVLYGWGLMMLDRFGSEPVLTPSPGDSIQADVLSSGVSWAYGRDQFRALNPAAIATANIVLNNSDRKYSPENSASPLAGDLDTSKQVAGVVAYGGTTYPLFFGRLDDYEVHADQGDRTASFTFQDEQAILQGSQLSTEVYQSMRTGELISAVLGLAGWSGATDIDPGATVVPFWWAEGQDALSAIRDLVLSEGTPAVAYVAPDGTFVFRDRHHRLLREQSLNVQASYGAAALGECQAPAVTGLDFTAPFVYNHGARDIVNSVVFNVSERTPDSAYTPVWTSDTPVTLSAGSALELQVTTADPFLDAQDIAVTDYDKSGAGALAFLLSRRSGAGLKITVTAIGASVTLNSLQLRARSIPVTRTLKVVRQDTGSISRHGERSYPEQAMWANVQDANAIATAILLQYASRRPAVQLRVSSKDPRHFIQAITGTVGDRIHIRNDEMGLDSDFFIERVQHTVQRMNNPGQAPIHSVVFGCERDLVISSNPFTFDVRGKGFDEGVFDPLTADDPATLFVFDDVVRGVFDTGKFGT